jgi:hypothetical protein
MRISVQSVAQLVEHGASFGFSPLFSKPKSALIEMIPLQEERDPAAVAEDLRKQSEVLRGALDRMGIEDDNINMLIDHGNRQLAKMQAQAVINNQFTALKRNLTNSKVFVAYQRAGVLQALDSVKVDLEIKLQDSLNVEASSEDFIREMYSVFTKLEKYETAINYISKENDDQAFASFENSPEKVQVERNLAKEGSVPGAKAAVREAMMQTAKDKFVFDKKVKVVEDNLMASDASFFETRLGMQIMLAIFGAILVGILTAPFVGPGAILFAAAGFAGGFAAGNAIYSATASSKERLYEESVAALRSKAGSGPNNLFGPYPENPAMPLSAYEFTFPMPGMGMIL